MSAKPASSRMGRVRLLTLARFDESTIIKKKEMDTREEENGSPANTPEMMYIGIPLERKGSDTDAASICPSTPTFSCPGTPTDTMYPVFPTDLECQLTPTDCKYPGFPTNGKCPTTPTEGKLPDFPTENKRTASPTESNRSGTPTDGKRPGTPTDGKRPGTPTGGKRPGTPTGSKRSGTPTDTKPQSKAALKASNHSIPVSSAMDNLNLSFAGGGFLGIYHLGVATTFARSGSRFLSKVKRFAGASAGSLVALALTVFGANEDILQQCAEFAYKLAEEVHKQPLGALSHKVSLLDPLEEFIEKVLPENAHQVASGRLFVSVTRKRKNQLVSEFSSREELIKYILASCYIPGVTGSEPIHINKQSFTDGGFTVNLPVLPEGRTITVSPLSGKRDICPLDDYEAGGKKYLYTKNQKLRMNKKNIQRSVHAFVPPRHEKLEEYFALGMSDTERFLRRLGYLELEEEMIDSETPVCLKEDDDGTLWYCTQL